MKKLIFAAGLLTVGLLATDFSQMSIAELNSMRSSVSSQDKSAYQAEVQSRVKAMDAAQRDSYKADYQNSSSNGGGSMQQHRYGSGAGSGSGGGKRKGGGGGGGRR